jgi:hypothetical protein
MMTFRSFRAIGAACGVARDELARGERMTGPLASIRYRSRADFMARHLRRAVRAGASCRFETNRSFKPPAVAT